jgi:hypothetical protein
MYSRSKPSSLLCKYNKNEFCDKFAEKNVKYCKDVIGACLLIVTLQKRWSTEFHFHQGCFADGHSFECHFAKFHFANCRFLECYIAEYHLHFILLNSALLGVILYGVNLLDVI